jgi:hypothetical protein
LDRRHAARDTAAQLRGRRRANFSGNPFQAS